MIELITNEAEYKGGIFPVIPSRVQGQDTLLIGVDGIPRLVDDYLTTRDIRKGNYNKIARVLTTTFSLDITLKATSKNAPYQFDVIVGIDCHVSNSVVYYMTKATHNVENSINMALSRVVNQEAKKFELMDSKVNDGLYKQLHGGGEAYILETLGITYVVVSVDTKPDADAERNFIKKMTDQKLNVMVEQHRITEAEKLTSRNMETAIISQVADGKIDMKLALEQLSKSNRDEGYNKLEDIERLISFVRKLQTDSLITDNEAGQRISELLRALPSNLSSSSVLLDTNTSHIDAGSSLEDKTLDELLPDGGDE